MTDKQLLEQALEALEKCKAALAEELSAWDIDPPLHHVQESHDLCGPAITDIRARLEQPEERYTYGTPLLDAFTKPAPVQEPVATIDSLEQEIYENTREFVSLNVMEWLLNRLNTTPPAAQPAPVPENFIDALKFDVAMRDAREWIGLTNEDVDNFLKAVWGRGVTAEDFIRAIEAKLKEKNTP